jgi:hypothetical protein
MMQTQLDAEAITRLRIQYPDLRDDYLDYLSRVGWGETQSGRMIYEGPVEYDEIYGPVDGLLSIPLLGNDFQGYCFGYNQDTGRYGEVADDGTWESWPDDQGITRYVAEPNENAK